MAVQSNALCSVIIAPASAATERPLEPLEEPLKQAWRQGLHHSHRRSSIPHALTPGTSSALTSFLPLLRRPSNILLPLHPHLRLVSSASPSPAPTLLHLEYFTLSPHFESASSTPNARSAACRVSGIFAHTTFRSLVICRSLQPNQSTTNNTTPRASSIQP